jgi:hypothetical protein
MAPVPLILDTNLLALLVVGLTDQKYISRHKRLRVFDETDFDIVARMVDQRGCLLTPNVVSETSNLIRYVADPMRSEAAVILARLVNGYEERFVPSKTAVVHKDYVRLGATDAVLLELTQTGATLVTDDLALYLAAVHAGLDAVNYNHIREARPDFR